MNKQWQPKPPPLTDEKQRGAQAPRQYLSLATEDLKQSLRYHEPLLLIILLALLVRVLWAWLFVGPIHTEGAEYASIAQNLIAGKGYVGLATEGKELMFPPLLPILIAVTSYLVQDFFAAGRLVSLAMGTLLVLPVYFISNLLYDRKVANVSALIVALHPLLITASSHVISEGPYMTLLMVAVYWSLRALKYSRPRDFSSAGSFFGLSYLIRPEAFMYPLLAIAFIAFANRNHHRRLQITLGSGLLLTTFLVLAVPYITFLSWETGELRVEGKSPLNYSVGQGIAEGKDRGEVSYSIDKDLVEHGVWNRSNLSVIKQSHFTFNEVARYAVVSAKRNLPELANVLASSSFLGSPILFALAVLGLFRRSWNRELAVSQMFLFMIAAVFVLALLSILEGIRPRYYFPFLPIFVVWAAKGVTELSRWGGSTTQIVLHRKPVSRRVEIAVLWVSVAGLCLLALSGVRHLPELSNFGPENRYVKEAGEWLRSSSLEPRIVMDTQGNLAFHAGAKYVPFPYSDSATALRYVDKKNVDFIVLRESDWSSRPYLRDWLENGVPDRRAQLIYSRETPTFGKTFIFKWNPLERRGLNLAPTAFVGTLEERP